MWTAEERQEANEPQQTELLGSLEGLLQQWCAEGLADGLTGEDRRRILRRLAEAIAGRPNENPLAWSSIQSVERDPLLVGRELSVLRRLCLQRWIAEGRVPDAASVTFHQELDRLVLDLTAGIAERERIAGKEARAWRERIHRIVEAGPIGIITWTTGGQIVEANDAFLRLIGRRREELVSGRIRWTDLTPPEFAEVDRTAIAELSRTGRSLHEKQYIRGDGRRIWILLGSAMLTDEGPDAISFVLDLTERKEAEAFRDRLLGIVSHDLRNPLSVIQSSVALLRRRRLDPELTPGLSRIDRATGRMQRMISDLLDFTRGTLGSGISVERHPMDLGQVLEQMRADHQALHPERPLELQARGDLRGSWDHDRLIQALENLLSNAFTHGRPHTPVEVRATGGPDAVEVEVHNEGDPIPAELLPVIFEPFRRRKGSTARTGLGLGLYITREIARAHAGQLSVEASGSGATFLLHLPRAPGPSTR